jgi:hypothetical protein
LASAVDDSPKLRELLQQGEPVTAHALLAAVQSTVYSSDQDYDQLFRNTEESLTLLLATGVDPNIRLESADPNLSGVARDWATGAPSDDRSFLFSWKECYPLYWTGMPSFVKYPVVKAHVDKCERLFLDHGADPYALFRQPLRPRFQFRGFPGIVEPEIVVFHETQGKSSGISNYEYRESIGKVMFNAHKRNMIEEWIVEAKKKGEEFEYDDDDFSHLSPLKWFPDEYGVRSLIHALLEDGGYMKPLLEIPNLDIERRDPQGRTMFLSACRNCLGADAAIDGCYREVYWNGETQEWSHNPFPQPNRLHSSSTTPETISMTQFFLQKGANILAVDNYGKHALFQLFESGITDYWVPFISYSLSAIVETAPQLIHQCDDAGNSPIHAALRHLRRSMRTLRRDTWFSEVYDVVYFLLDKGADPKAQDELGNTALHYLADERLVDDYLSEKNRQLFRKFVDLGVDINTRNKAGKRPVDLFVALECRKKWKYGTRLESDVFDLLGRAEVSWDEKKN